MLSGPILFSDVRLSDSVGNALIHISTLADIYRLARRNEFFYLGGEFGLCQVYERNVFQTHD